jgi:CRP-like cAMP-binding protein
MALDFSSIKGHQLHLQEPKDAVAITDGIEVFSVPRKYVAAILKEVPELRYSFEHVGGQHHGSANEETADGGRHQKVEEKKFATVPWKDAR